MTNFGNFKRILCPTKCLSTSYLDSKVFICRKGNYGEVDTQVIQVIQKSYTLPCTTRQVLLYPVLNRR